ncbi:MAG: glycoside hydrolase family 5 protein [Planctomycetaceae bacterium]|nr:glycoside hydrolase family 5 protein [Planctomycetaceae bacterium]
MLQWYSAMIVVAAFAGWAAFAVAGEAPTPVSRHGKLRVEGTQLVDMAGRPVQLRGMSTHGITWYPEYANVRAILDTRSRGANLFRVAMYADSVHGGYNESEYGKRNSAALLRLAVENSLEAGMYTIIDWHILEDKNPLLTVDSAVDFFDTMSSIYKDEPGIIYEICNEPNGDTTWDQVVEYAMQVIPAIRKNAPDAVILVGTPSYSFDVLSVRGKPLPFDNIMYSFHMYTGFTDYQFVSILDTMRAEGYPIFVSEWGVSTDANTGKLDIEEGRAFIDYMRQHQLSWVNWSLCNKEEDFSAIRPDSNKLSGWTDEDLTESGQLIFPALAGE